MHQFFRLDKTFYLLYNFNKMFFLSQVALHKFKLCHQKDLSTYSIATGIAIYAGIYLYFLYYNEPLLSVFNKFLFYVISVDLLLSTFYFYQYRKKQDHHSMNIEFGNEDQSQLTEENRNDSCDELIATDDEEDQSENEQELDNETYETEDDIEDESETEDEMEEQNEKYNVENEVDNKKEQDDKNSTEIILKEAEDIIQSDFVNENNKNLHLNEKLNNTTEQHNILLMEDNLQIKPRRRRKAALQV